MLLTILPQQAKAQFYTGSNLTFGRKRIQYESFFWTFYRFNGFDVYFNRKGKNLALYTASYVQNHLAEMEEKVGVESSIGMKFIVFNRLTDFKQSNIGYVDDMTESSRNTGGVTHFADNKVFLYFNGSYVEFERQIREGIAEMLVSQSLNGSVGKQMANSYTSDLPYWFRAGLSLYFSREWDVSDDEKLQAAIKNKSFLNISDLEGDEARLAGFSFFHFVAEKYGHSTVSRCLNVASRAKTMKKTFERTFNRKFSEMEKEWIGYYREQAKEFTRPESNLPVVEKISRTKKKNSTYGNIVFNDKYTAYVRNHLGRATVWVLDSNNHRRCVYRIGASINDYPDYSFPILAWHPNGHQLSIISEEKGRTMLIMHDMEVKRRRDRKMRYNLEIFEKINSFTFTPNGREIVFAGVSNGASDIFRFHLGAGTYKQITNDLYDDYEPLITFDGKIVFSSNRPDDTLRVGEKFMSAPSFGTRKKLYMPLSQKLLQPLVNDAFMPRLTELPSAGGSSGSGSDGADGVAAGVFYLTDENGITNIGYGEFGREISHIDTAIHYKTTFAAKTVTDLSPGLKEIAGISTGGSAPRYRAAASGLGAAEAGNRAIANSGIITDSRAGGAQVGIVALTEKGYQLSLADAETLAEQPARQNKPSPLARKQRALPPSATADSSKTPEKKQPKRLRLYNARPEDIAETTAFDKYLQEKRFLLTAPAENATTPAGTDPQSASALLLTAQEAPKIPEAQDSIDTKIPPKQYTYDVEYSINEATTQLGFDFLSAGYQAYSGNNGPIYLNPAMSALTKIGMSDLMENHRIIGGFGIGYDLSNTEFLISYENLERRLSHQIILHLANTTDETDIATSTRNRSYTTHYVAKYPLNPANMIKSSVFGRLDQIVYRATSPIAIAKKNDYVLRLGLRGEWVYDHSRYIMPNIYNGFRSKAWIEYYQGVWGKKDNLFVVGFDARYYKKIYRTFIWASRFATSTSFGQSKLIYYMGGVDSWMLPSFSQEMRINDKMDYAYQTLATNMRGFPQNIRNGNTFAVINTELRCPIVQMLSKEPVGSAFWRNLMVVAFVDVGSAWAGLNPFSKDNTYYKKVIENGPITIELERNAYPFVAGFGAGLRAQIGGYSLRLDCAWGAADYMVSRRPKLHFSLATDF
jgi:hypothetical protein